MKSGNRTILALALGAAPTGAQSTYTPYTFTTLAGGGGFSSTNGTGGAERLWVPSGVAVDTNGNVYVGDQFNYTIRKVSPAGEVTTLAGLTGSYGSVDGTGSAARFRFPQGVAVDGAGNIYVADTGNNTIRIGYRPVAITSFGPNIGFSGGQFSFNLTGPTGKLVVVEASSDLVSWLPLWTNTVADPLHFSEPQSGVYSNAFTAPERRNR